MTNEEKPPPEKSHIHPHCTSLSTIGHKNRGSGRLGDFIPVCAGSLSLHSRCLVVIGVIR